MTLKKKIAVIFLFMMQISYSEDLTLKGVFVAIGHVNFPISALSEKEIGQIENKQVVFFKNKAVFDFDTCTITKIVNDTLVTKEYLGQILNELEKKIRLKIPEKIKGRSLFCNGKFWESYPNHFFFITKNLLLTISEGVVFILNRVTADTLLINDSIHYESGKVKTIIKPQSSFINHSKFQIDSIMGTWTIDPKGPNADFQLSKKFYFVVDYDGNGNMVYTIHKDTLSIYFPELVSKGIILKACCDSLRMVWETKDTITYVRWKN